MTRGMMTLDKLKKASPTTIDLIKPDTFAQSYYPAARFPGEKEPIALTRAKDDEPRKYRSRTLAYQAAVKLLDSAIKDWPA